MNNFRLKVVSLCHIMISYVSVKLSVLESGEF